jgi:hypothetical protein
MPRAATAHTIQRVSKRTPHQPQSAPSQITSAQVWHQLSATQQQVLQRTLTSVCRRLVNRTASDAGSEEEHDDES